MWVRTSPGTSCPRRSSSWIGCRGRRPARCRSSNCARRNGPVTPAASKAEAVEKPDMLADDSYTEEMLRSARIGKSMGTDYFGLRDELTDAERDYLQRTREFVDDEVLPVINDYWQRAEFPWKLIEKLGG